MDCNKKRLLPSVDRPRVAFREVFDGILRCQHIAFVTNRDADAIAEGWRGETSNSDAPLTQIMVAIGGAAIDVGKTQHHEIGLARVYLESECVHGY